MSSFRIQQGLNTLSQISSSIKNNNTRNIPSIFRRSALAIGNSALSSQAASVQQGANAVLSEVGINPNLLTALGVNSHQVVQRGLNVAQGVFSNVVNGVFGRQDISGVTQPFEDLDRFITGQQNIITPNSIDTIVPSPFASDKSMGMNHPKFKFLFVVQFILNDDYQDVLGENANNMAFVVRRSSRPNIHVDYEEVNMYNYKTKVPKFTEYQPITMGFLDDQSNQTTSFYKKFAELMIPNLQIPEPYISEYEETSFHFLSDNTIYNNNSSMLQALPGRSGHKNIIKTIRLFHIWGWGKFVNVYKFHNPKMTEINISDLDMESTDFTEIEIQFSYDGLNIQTNTDSGNNISLDPNSPDSGGYNLTDYTRRGDYPVHYNGSSFGANSIVNGDTTELPDRLKKSSLETWDFTNPNAPDSDFLPELRDNSGFPDFNSLLGAGIDTATNLLSNQSDAAKIANTLSTARSVFGDAIPNVNNIRNIF